MFCRCYVEFKLNLGRSSDDDLDDDLVIILFIVLNMILIMVIMLLVTVKMIQMVSHIQFSLSCNNYHNDIDESVDYVIWAIIFHH